MYTPYTLPEIARATNQGIIKWQTGIFGLIDDINYDNNLFEIISLEPLFDDIKLQSLSQAVVRELAKKIKKIAPGWCHQEIFLDSPWFPSGIENLKASCILESPLEFRRNNIFVLKNFMVRV